MHGHQTNTGCDGLETVSSRQPLPHLTGASLSRWVFSNAYTTSRVGEEAGLLPLEAGEIAFINFCCVSSFSPRPPRRRCPDVSYAVDWTLKPVAADHHFKTTREKTKRS